MSETRHVTTIIDRPAAEVYDFVRDPQNLPRWAAGLGGTDVQHEVEQWSMNTPMGRVLISFVPENPYGVLDHSVTLPTGESTFNPMRVISVDDQRSEVIFSLRRAAMSEDEFEADAEAVAEDLAELTEILEKH
ncbi:SRPBCC family protein [Brachybacterium muris]|uniref:SRPBCC family protein n=1 Tax=Brachybacterium muris TaxID=219301 RepID=UPI00223BAAFB|nr:SRPBCC family protein [Brachybacterium muris]MCT1998635.1 SRPBCC family protein [Brachybacterium muris]MCT2262633.1 SRPBCC family protein [Brachybacterium muris]MCT2296562.1 SRPBCC family protein [Brachybacterium muris]